MPLDISWALSLSITGIIATVGVLSIINIFVNRTQHKNKKPIFHKYWYKPQRNV